MWSDIKQLYRDSLSFAIALPILFSIPALIEFAQHVVEIDLGMFRREGVAVAVDQRRLILGYAKTLSLILPSYWFVRYLASDRNARHAARIAWPAAALFGVQFATQAAVQWYALFGTPLGEALSLGTRASNVLTTLAIAVGFIGGIYLTALFVAWPLGNLRIGPISSAVIMAGSFWRTVGYSIAGTAPLMMLHYALNYGALGRPATLVWVMMASDALAVGVLGLTTAGAAYLAVRHAAGLKDVSLSGAPKPIE
jgi:hypothetical protein